ncbi:MAG: iron-sulfur cluster assembly scaffold protein [Candidatus ainarchaeum sp.]|nr:iron-sulfur cluster assembly scaffold protein [Candidatus ainarchaeum sp.]
MKQGFRPDVVGSGGWFYSEKVKDHFFNPRNIFKTKEEAKKFKADGIGAVGSPQCGDVMELRIKVDKKKDRIKECKFRTFGCASAIASTSMLTVMVTEKGGMKLEDAMKLKPKDIMGRLGGLPERKVHCSVLGDKALREAINDYFRKSGQFERVKEEGTKIIDKALKITGKDIEDAVLEGAKGFEEVQKMTKVGIKDKNCIPEVKRLIRHYRAKHFGKS